MSPSRLLAGPCPRARTGGPMRGAALLLAAFALALPCTRAHAEEAAPAAAPTVPVHPALQILEPWLRNEDWTVRAIAAFELRKRAEAGAVHLAARALARESHPYAAACALTSLRGRPRTDLVMEGGAELVDALLRFVEHAHPTVRTRAREVLAVIPPVRLGRDPAVYRGWWRRGRTTLVREQHKLLAAARAAPPAKAPNEGGSTSQAPGEDDRFYGRLERMRKHGLELCIVLDNTGSMGGVIAAAKARAVALIRRLRAYVPGFRAGLVTYQDAGRLRVTLTQEEEHLRKAFNKVAANGGGDWEEGVDKGIRLALRQERLGWSQRAYRVLVVVGDAPPHDADVPGLLRALQKARADELYDHPVVVHTVSTSPRGVDHFPQIALAGGGQHVTLLRTGRLVEELVLLTFGGGHRERVRAWMEEIDALREAEPE